jgi:cell division protein ZapA
MSAETVNVTIYNSEYKLRGEDPDKIKRAAAIIDDQMKRIAAKAPMQPAATTAVLAALNTADELLTEQATGRDRIADFLDQLDTLDRRLQALADGSA